MQEEQKPCYFPGSYSLRPNVNLESDYKNQYYTHSTEKKPEIDISQLPALNLNRIEVLEVLGKGGFGKVYSAYNYHWNVDVKDNFNNHKLLALKSLDLDETNEKIEQVNNEIKILGEISKLNDPVFTNLYGVMIKEQSLLIAMEFGYENMRKILKYRRENNEDFYSPQEISYTLTYLSKGFHEVNKLDIVHRDIKPQNLILSVDESAYRYKISDFGIAMKLPAGEQISFCGSTKFYEAPEVRGQKTYDPRKSDVYSLGIVALEMMGFSGNEIKKIKDNGVQLPTNKKNYKEIWHLIEMMLCSDPHKRSSFEEIFKECGKVKQSKPKETYYVCKIRQKNLLKKKTKFPEHQAVWNILSCIVDLFESDITQKIKLKKICLWNRFNFKGSLPPSDYQDLEKLTEIIREEFDEKHIFFHYFLMEYESILSDSRQIEKSFNCNKKAYNLLLFNKFYGNEEVYFGRIYYRLARNYYELKNTEKSLFFIKKHEMLASKADPLDFLKTISLRCQIFQDSNQKTAMKEYLREKREFFLKFEREDPHCYFTILVELGILIYKYDDAEKAMGIHQKAFDFLRLGATEFSIFFAKFLEFKSYFLRLPNYVNIFQNFCEIFLSYRSFWRPGGEILFFIIASIKKSCNYLEECLSIASNFFGKDSIQVAVPMFLLGRNYLFLGEFEKYKLLLKNCYNIFKKFYGENHPETQLSQKILNFSVNCRAINLSYFDFVSPLFQSLYFDNGRINEKCNYSVEFLKDYAILYKKIGKFQESLLHAKKAYSLACFLQDSDLIEESALILANILEDCQKKQKAINFYEIGYKKCINSKENFNFEPKCFGGIGIKKKCENCSGIMKFGGEIPSYKRKIYFCEKCYGLHFVNSGVFYCESCRIFLCKECASDEILICKNCKAKLFWAHEKIENISKELVIFESVKCMLKLSSGPIIICEICGQKKFAYYGFFACLQCQNFHVCFSCKSFEYLELFKFKKKII